MHVTCSQFWLGNIRGKQTDIPITRCCKYTLNTPILTREYTWQANWYSNNQVLQIYLKHHAYKTSWIRNVTKSKFENLIPTKISNPTVYVTKFAKRGLIHASNFSTLRMSNSAFVGPTALKFGGRPFLSLY